MSGYGSDTASERLERNTVRLTPIGSSPTEASSRASSPSGSESGKSQASQDFKTYRGSRGYSSTAAQHIRKKLKSEHRPGDNTLYRYLAPNNPELQQVARDRFYQLDPSDEEGSESNGLMDGPVKVPVADPSIRPTQGISGASCNDNVYPASTTYRRSFEDAKAPRGDSNSPSRTRDRYFGRNEAETHRRSSLSLNEKDSVHGLLQLANGPARRMSTSNEMATSPPWTSPLSSDRTLPAIAPEHSTRAVSSSAAKPEVSLPPFSELVKLPTRQRASSISSANSPTRSPPQVDPLMLPQPIPGGYTTATALNRTSTASSRDAGSPIGALFAHHSPEVPNTMDRISNHPRRSAPRASPSSIPSLVSTSNTSTSSSRSYSTTASSGTSSGNEGFTPFSSHGSPITLIGHNEDTMHSPATDNPTKYLHYPTVPIGGYKCQHDGCDAPPFSTQYLLNSHANVHSQERPHFCAVKGCPRGEGGRGFKRKNEMIRHGLVHESPGYLCPWCDREHRYPRPDNLQRHVTTHHRDKSRDDPQLLAVLAQRAPGGVTRGRRRRV